MWGRLSTCGRLPIGLSAPPEIDRRVDNPPQDGILPHNSHYRKLGDGFLESLQRGLQSPSRGVNRATRRLKPPLQAKARCTLGFAKPVLALPFDLVSKTG